MRVERARVRGLLDLAFWREGRGGIPLLLVHGWPETKRIWQRNVAALAAAGFEVIDAARFRASIANYEPAAGRRAVSEPVRFFEPNPVPTLVLFGPEDHVVGPSFLAKAEVAFPDRLGPFVVPGAGHFLQWERAEVLNRALVWCCADLVRTR